MKKHSEKRILAGVILLSVGFFLLLRYLDIVPYFLPGYLISWKTLLIFLGVVFLITDRNKSTGVILIIIGSVFLSSDIFKISLGEVLRVAIPLVLILTGLFLILRRQSYSSREFNIPEDADGSDYLNDISIFGGGEKKIRSSSFKGGRITAIFGGSEIDFRGAQLSPGINAIDMLCVFGGVSFRIPDDWEVRNDVSAIFGGFSDSRLIDKKIHSNDPGKVLYLKGLVLFGGGEIK